MPSASGATAQVETAYARVRDLIVAGEYEAGARLAELPLAAALSMSRTPVREALRRLESDGLVRSTGRGVVVAALDERRLEEAYQVRAALEGLTAELAAGRQREGRIAPAELAELRRIEAATADATARGELDTAVERNRAFHRHIAVLAANETALAALDRLWDQMAVSIRASLTPVDRREEATREHRDLADAIERGDAERAARAARHHVLATAAARRG